MAEEAPELFEKARELDDRLGNLNPPQHLNGHERIRQLVENAKMQRTLAITIPRDECSSHCFT